MLTPNIGKKSGLSIAEAVARFKTLAEPLIEKGDFKKLSRLHAQVYASVIRQHKHDPLAGMEIEQALEKALHELLTQTSAQRGSFPQTYGSNWWRRT